MVVKMKVKEVRRLFEKMEKEQHEERIEELEQKLAWVKTGLLKSEQRLERVIEYTNSRAGTEIPGVAADVIVGICEGRYGENPSPQKGSTDD